MRLIAMSGTGCWIQCLLPVQPPASVRLVPSGCCTGYEPQAENEAGKPKLQPVLHASGRLVTSHALDTMDRILARLLPTMNLFSVSTTADARSH